MSKQMVVAALAAVATAVAWGEGAVKPLKVMMIGNSYSGSAFRQTPVVAKTCGCPLDLCSLNIGGCTLERHVQNVNNPTSKPYNVAWNWTSSEKPPFRHRGNIPEMLQAEKWDVVTIQQASHFSWKPETYHPYGDNLVKYIRENAPGAKIVVHETWSYTPWDKRLAGWKIDQNEMYEKLHAAYADFAKGHGLDVIPTGTAVQLWRRELPVKYTENSLGGDVVGSAKFVEKDGKWVPQGDVFHLNGDGNYLQALVWTAKLFGADVTKCPYAPAGLPAAKAELMKKVAMTAVRGQ